MDNNEYDAMLEGPASPSPSNPYEAMVDDDRSLQKDSLKQTLYTVKDQNPDHAAKVQGLSRQMNLPPEFVARNYDDLAKKAEYSRDDYDDIIESTPKFAAWMENKANAALVKDDIHEPRQIEKTIEDFSYTRTFKDALITGLAQANAGLAKTPGYLAEAFTQFQNAKSGALNTAIDVFGGDQPKREMLRTPEVFFDNPVVHATDQRYQDLATQVPALSGSIKKEISAGNYERASKVMLAQIASNTPNLILMLALGKKFGDVGGLSYAGVTSAADAQYDNRQNLRLSPEAAFANSTLKGAAEVGGEYVGTFLPLKGWEDAITRQFGKQVSAEVMKDFAKTFAYTTGINFLEEATTEAAQIATDVATDADPEVMKGAGERVINAGLVGAALGGAAVSPVGIMAGIDRHMKINHVNESKEKIAKISKIFKEMKLFSRSPEAAEQLLKETVKDTPDEFAYVDPNTIETYFQSKGINPVAVMSELGLLPEFGHAKETGNDVAIPMEKFVGRIIGEGHTELGDQWSDEPGGLTLRQLSEEQKRVETQAKAVEDKAAEEQDNQERQAIWEELAQQMKDAGASPEEIEIARRQIGRIAEALGGVSLDAVLEQHPLRVTNQTAEEERSQLTPEQLAAEEEHNKIILEQQRRTYDHLPQEGNVVDATDAFKRGREKPVEQLVSEESLKDEYNDIVRAQEEGPLTPEQRAQADRIKAELARRKALAAAGDPEKRAFYEKLIEKNRKEYDKTIAKMADEASTLKPAARNKLKKKAMDLEVEHGQLQDKRRKALPHNEAMVDALKARFSEDSEVAAAIDEAQDPTKGPYVADSRIEGIGWAPNYAAEPTGTIGAPYIQHQTGVRKGRETDPFKWADDKYKAAKQLLQKHQEKGMPTTINTSSDLIGKDDYIALIPPGSTVNIYMLTKDDQINRVLFPGNPSNRRLEQAADRLKEAGIKVRMIRPTYESVIEAVGGEAEARALLGEGDPEFEEMDGVPPDGLGYVYRVFTEDGDYVESWSSRRDAENSIESMGEEGLTIQAVRAPEKVTSDLTDLRRVVSPGLTVLKQDSLDEVQKQRRQKELEQAFGGDDLAARYAALPGSEGGKLIDPDNIRNLDQRYASNGREGKILHLEETGKPAYAAAEKLFDERIKSQDPGPVVMTAGGSASGKTTYAENFVKTNEDAVAIFDSTSTNYDQAKSRIERALSAGHEVVYDYIYSPFDQAIEGNKVRFREMGRLVDPHTMARSHVEALDTFIRLRDEYKGDPRVTFGLYQRNGENLVWSPLDKADDLRYNKDGKSVRSAIRELEKQAKKALENEVREVHDARARYLEAQNQSDRPGDVGADSQSRGSEAGLSGEVSQDAGTKTLKQGPLTEKQRKARARAMGFDTSQVWYHGTPSGEFEEFRHSNYSGIAAFFTQDEKFAKKFAEDPYYNQRGVVLEGEEDPKVYAVYLKAKNRFDYVNRKHVDAVFKRLSRSDLKEISGGTRINGKPMSGADLKRQFALGNWNYLEHHKFVEAAKAAGFDSMYVFENGKKNLAVFSPNQIRSVDASFEAEDTANIYLQREADGPQGQIDISDSGSVIRLFRSANRSTAIHELTHYTYNVLAQIALRPETPQQFKDDIEALHKWVGKEEGKPLTVEQQEQIANGFEEYVMEGKAPTKALQRIFDKFKLWLTHIYKYLKAKGVELTPEVRQVFDRMLVSQEEIDRSRREQHLNAMFTAANITDEKFNRYQQAIEAARMAADDKLRAEVMADIRKQDEKAYKEAKARITEEVTTEAQSDQVFRAQEILRRQKLPDGSALPEGTPKIKLDRNAVLNEYGADALPKLKGYLSNTEGLHPDIVAELTGYDNGTALMQDLLTRPKMRDWMDFEINRRLEDVSPNLFNTDEMVEQGLQAVHNDAQEKVLRMELELLREQRPGQDKSLARRIARPVLGSPELREQVREIVGRQNVREINPRQYKTAEAKWGRQAFELYQKGDIDGAIEAKRLQLYNHELFRVASEAKEEVKKQLEKFKRFGRSDEKLAKSRDINLIDTGRAILAAFGIGRTEQSPASYLEKLKAYDPEGYESAAALVLSATEGRSGNYNEVPFNDFKAMADSVNAIWDLAKSQSTITIEGKRLAKERVIQDLKAEMDQFTPKRRKEYTETAGKWEKANSLILAARADLTRVEHWAEAMGPSFVRYIWRPVSQAVTNYRLAKMDVIARLRTLLESHRALFTHDPIVADELGHKFRNKPELLMALLHSGNESNLYKLLAGGRGGRAWGDVLEDGTVDTSKWDAFIARAQREGILTKADYDFVQSIWDLNEELKPGAQKAHKAMFGRYFNEITHKAFQTPWGEYRGGYIPAKVDVFESEDANIRQERESFEKNNNSYQFPTTGRGFTKARVARYAAPLSLDMNLLGGHIDAVLRFTHIEPTVKEVARVVMDKEFREALKAIDPEIAKFALVPWLQRAAQQRVVLPSESGVAKALDAVAAWLRRGAAAQIMFGNVTNTLQQYTGVSVAASKVAPRHLRDAMTQYMTAPKKTSDAVIEMSPFMKSTQGSTLYESVNAIEKILIDPSTYDNIKSFTDRHVYFLQSAAQNQVNTVVWIGAYNEAIESGKTHDEAVLAGDSAVRLTQGTNNPEDISRYETGTHTARLFKQFIGYFNMLGNLNGYGVQKISRDIGLKKGAGKAFYLYASALMVPAVVSALIVKAMAGKGLDEDDDGSYLDDLLMVFFGSQLQTMIAPLPYVGAVGNATVAHFNNKAYDDRLALSPVVTIVEGLAGTPANVYKNIVEDADNKKQVTRDVLTLIGIMTQMPVAPFAKPAGYLQDLDDGRTESTGPIDFARGIVTGKGSS